MFLPWVALCCMWMPTTLSIQAQWQPGKQTVGKARSPGENFAFRIVWNCCLKLSCKAVSCFSACANPRLIIQISHHWLLPYKLCLVGRTELHDWCCPVQHCFHHWTGRQFPACVCCLATKDIQMGINSDVHLGRRLLPHCWSLLCPARHGPPWSLAGYVVPSPLFSDCPLHAVHCILCLR